MKKNDSREEASLSFAEIKWPTYLEMEGIDEPSSPARTENAYRDLIENLPVMCYVAEPDPPYSPIYTSPALNTFGYSLEEWRTNAALWLDVIHPDDLKGVVEKTNAARTAGAELDYEYRIVAQNGKTHWVRDRGLFLKDGNGDLVCWLGIMLDVTDRKLAEEGLRESEELYRSVFDRANDIIYVHDLEGNCISGNRSIERVLGYSTDELVSMNISQVLAPGQIDIVKKNIDLKISGATNKTEYELTCLTKYGKQVSLEINSAVVSKNGRPVGIQGIARDITERKSAEVALRKSEQRYRGIFENSNDLIILHDIRGKMSSINKATVRKIGYSSKEARTMNVNQFIAPESLEFAREMIKRKIGGEKLPAYEIALIARDGTRIPVEINIKMIVKDGEPSAILCNARDITERQRAERSLRETVSLLTSTLESSNDGIVVQNDQGKIVVHNKRFVEMWSVPDELIEKRDGKEIAEFVKNQLREPERFIEGIERLSAFPLETSSDLIEFADGRTFERYSQPQYMEGEAVGRVITFRDVTERLRSEATLRHNALYDSLTNLPNRTLFINHLRKAIKRAEKNPLAQFAVLFLDLDRFKVVNDSLGHFVGDELLIGIAERLKSCLRPGDVVARLGGDEFTILLNRSGIAENVTQVASRLQAKLSESFKMRDFDVSTTASLGIILSDDSKRSPEDYLRDADAAMYRAKESGRARYAIFDREMHVRNMNLLQVEMDLRQAIERDEFEVYYQPIVPLDSGFVCEFEGLIRWRHPKHGLLPPSKFIDVAEETGLILQIGRKAIAQSCDQIAAWQKIAPFPLSVSVNLSAKQLMSSSLTDEVRNALKKTGLNARQLKLEVTETTVMENSDAALGALSELEDLGIPLSTDDFGTGYSSLSYLHRFPFTRLKIDKSFVMRMYECQKTATIVKTILMLGENLGIDVVAEGIETEQQLILLRELGCKSGQGYFFSKPVDAASAERLLFSVKNQIPVGYSGFRRDRNEMIGGFLVN